MTTATSVPDLQSLAKLLSERHDQLAEQYNTTADRHERALILGVSGLLHQTAQSIYTLRDYRNRRDTP
jgi:hypothetical protein